MSANDSTRSATRDMRLERGEFQGGRAPFGYRKTPGRGGSLEVDEVAAQVVRLVFTLYLEVRSISTVNAVLTARGTRSPSGRRWTSATTWLLLHNRTYAGYVIYLGRECRGKHVPLVPEETFDAVQTVLAANNKRDRARPQVTT